MQQGVLDKEMIAQPELWRLVLMPGDDRLDVALLPPVSGEEMIWRTFPYGHAASGRLKALQDVVYENPLLLSDFKTVECIADCGTFMAMPAGMDIRTIEETGHMVLAPDDEGCHMVTSGCEATNAVVTQWIDSDIYGFLCRTFYNISFHSRMARLIDYLLASAGDDCDAGAVHVLVRADELTLVINRGRELLCANSFRFRGDSDAVYYILAAVSALGLEPGSIPVYIGGENVQAMCGTFSTYLPGTVAMSVPPLRFRAGRNTLAAPFDFLIRQSCE